MAKTLEQVTDELEAANKKITEKESEANKIIKDAEEEKLKLQKEFEELKKSHSNTLSANERISQKNKEKEIENEDILKLFNEQNEEIEKINKTISEAKIQTEIAKTEAKKDLIKKALKKSGFTSEELLINQIDIDKIEIKDGVVSGLEENVKVFKEKYPQLYVDGAAGSNVGKNPLFKQNETNLFEKLQKIENNLKSGKEISEEDKMIAIFGKAK